MQTPNFRLARRGALATLAATLAACKTGQPATGSPAACGARSAPPSRLLVQVLVDRTTPFLPALVGRLPAQLDALLQAGDWLHLVRFGGSGPHEASDFRLAPAPDPWAHAPREIRAAQRCERQVREAMVDAMAASLSRPVDAAGPSPIIETLALTAGDWPVPPRTQHSVLILVSDGLQWSPGCSWLGGNGTLRLPDPAELARQLPAELNSLSPDAVYHLHFGADGRKRSAMELLRLRRVWERIWREHVHARRLEFGQPLVPSLGL